MNIIDAHIDHLDDLVPLFDAYRVFYRQPSDKGGARRFLIERFKNKDSVIFIAYEQKAALGFVQLYPLLSSISMQHMMLLNDLYIISPERSKGIGTALIEKAKEYCRLKDQKGMAIQTETTNRAQELYKSLGFEKDPDLHMFWKNC